MDSELSMAVGVELLRAELRRLAVDIEAIDKEDIRRISGGGDVVRSIAVDDAEAVIVGGDVELLPQQDHLWIDFDDGKVGRRNVAAGPFHERAASQTDHGDACRMGTKEPEGAHGAGVGEDQEIRIAGKHLALDFADLKLKTHAVAVFTDVWTNVGQPPVPDTGYFGDCR
jgi:hypothetical protein